MDFNASVENSKMILSKRASFLATYRRDQNFALPDSIMFYVSQNPPSTKLYEKMIESCKYFFVKNPILVISRCYLKYGNGWRTFFNEKSVVDLKNLSSKIWISDEFAVENYSSEQNQLSPIVSKFCKSDVKELTLQNQNISFNDFIFLASKCDTIWFWNGATVFNEDKTVVSLEKIIEVLPKLTRFSFNFFQNGPQVITPQTVKELLKISNFAHLTEFTLSNVPDTFDLETFYGFIKKNKKTKICLSFSQQISGEYKNRLRNIKDTIFHTKDCDYIKPLIF